MWAGMKGSQSHSGTLPSHFRTRHARQPKNLNARVAEVLEREAGKVVGA